MPPSSKFRKMRKVSESEELAVSKISLPGQIARSLKKEIEKGRWQGSLPGERRLAEILQVSRTSLRPALRQLESEGIVRNSHGRHREIVRSRQLAGNPSTPTVTMISPMPLEQMEPSMLLQLENLRDMISRRRMQFHIEVRPACYVSRPGNALGLVVEEMRSDVWILWRFTREMQHWFRRKNLKSIIYGTAFFPETAHVDIDHHAVGRHAALTFARNGHRRMAMTGRDSDLAGDRAAVRGFSEGAKEMGCHSDMCYHDGSPTGVFRSVDKILSYQPRPTAIFSSGGIQTLSVVTWVLKRRLRIPEDISIISRDDDLALAHITPRPACYQKPERKFARAMMRQIENQLSLRHVPAGGILILPEFQSHGQESFESLAPNMN